MSEENGITVCPMERGYIVAEKGKGTRQESPAVRDFVSGVMEDGVEVLVDLSQCDYLDSTFLGCLVILHKRGAAYDGSFRIYAEDDVRGKLLHPTRLDQVLTFCQQRPAPAGAAVELHSIDLEREEFGRHLLATHEELARLDSPSSDAFARVAEQLRQELGGA